MPLMDFADSLTPEDMAEWNKAIAADSETGDNKTGEKKARRCLRTLRLCGRMHRDVA